MRINKTAIWLGLPAVCILAYFYWAYSYQEFEPVLFDGGIDAYKSITVDSKFHKNLAHVLEYYDKSYKISKTGKILVKRTLLWNKELIYNYTKKALDSNWQYSHN